MRADEILHPQYFSRRTASTRVFQPSGADPLLLRGVLLQRQGHQHSAERVYARAARLRPNDDEAQVAAAVGALRRGQPLGVVLAPRAARASGSRAARRVRYHLGLLLAWTGQRDAGGRAVPARAARSGPTTKLGKQANVVPARASCRVGLRARKDEPVGLWRPSAR